jgi:hypothetical protein
MKEDAGRWNPRRIHRAIYGQKEGWSHGWLVCIISFPCELSGATRQLTTGKEEVTYQDQHH